MGIRFRKRLRALIFDLTKFCRNRFVTDLVQLLLDHPALGDSQKHLDQAQAVSNLCHDAHGGIVPRKGCLQKQGGKQVLLQAAFHTLCPFWHERAVPARLCDCGGYLQSTADTALAGAGHHAAGQSSWTPGRNGLWSVEEPVPASAQQSWDCAPQPPKVSFKETARSL